MRGGLVRKGFHHGSEGFRVAFTEQLLFLPVGVLVLHITDDVSEDAVAAEAEIGQQIVYIFKFRQPFPQEALPCILVHEVPGLLPHGLPQSGHPFRRQVAEQGVQLVGIVCILLPSGIQNALHIALPLFLLHWNAAGPDAGKAGVVIPQQRIHRRQLIGVQLLPPVRLPGEGKQFLILGGLCLDARRVLFQLLCQIRQTLHVGVHLAPIRLFEKRFHLGGMGRLVPDAPGLCLLYQRLIFEEGTALDGLVGQVLIQIGADAALG